MHISALLTMVFPACAGVILDELWKGLKLLCIPRMRGGDPLPLSAPAARVLYSPHARG